MASQTSSPFVLVVGLPTNHKFFKDASDETNEVLKKVQEQLKLSKEFAAKENCGMTVFGLGPEEGISPFEKALKEYKPSVIMIGGGIKSMPPCHDLLENIINSTINYSIEKSKSTPIVIVPNPTAILETAKKAIDLAMKSKL